MPAPNRWASAAIVDMLIGMKNYESAAEVVSGSTEMFANYSKRIRERLEENSTEKLIGPTGEFIDLSQYAHIAMDEISLHKEWQAEVIAKLPKEDDETGATGPLRQEFHRAAQERDKLFSQLTEYLKAVS